MDLDLQGWGQQALGCEATFHFSLANNYDDCSHLSPLSSRLWGHPYAHSAEDPNPKVKETRLPAVKSLWIPRRPGYLLWSPSEFPGFLPAAPRKKFPYLCQAKPYTHALISSPWLPWALALLIVYLSFILSCVQWHFSLPLLVGKVTNI